MAGRNKFSYRDMARKAALHQIYETSPFGIGGHFVIVLIVAFSFIGVVPFSVIFIGVGAHSLILLFRSYTAWSYFQTEEPIKSPEDIDRWSRNYAIGAFLTGTAWGLSFVIFLYGVPPEYHFFLYTIIIGLSGAGIVTLGTVFSIYLSYMIPILGIFSLWFLFQDGKIYLITAPLNYLVMLFYYFTARRYSINFSKAIAEKERAISTQYEIIQRLSHASELKDQETGMHIQRMSRYVYLLARESGHSKSFSEALCHASTLHDVGKIGIPDYILLKEGDLSEEERNIINTHTEIGKRILEGSDSELLILSESIAYTHHEKYDGSGYPRGLKGEEIPIEGRITAICDVFDALVSSKRSYKSAWSNEEAFAYIREQSGVQFDPVLVEHFMRLAPRIIDFQKNYDNEIENCGYVTFKSEGKRESE